MSKKRFLSYWYIRRVFGKFVLFGYEHHAARWVTDRIIWQGCGEWRRQQYYQYHCENGRYLVVGQQGPKDKWLLEDDDTIAFEGVRRTRRLTPEEADRQRKRVDAAMASRGKVLPRPKAGPDF